jgi:hypothetical protein
MCSGNGCGDYCKCNPGHPLVNSLNVDSPRTSDHIKMFWEMSALWKSTIDVVHGFEGFRTSKWIDDTQKDNITHIITELVNVHKYAEAELEKLRKVRV